VRRRDTARTRLMLAAALIAALGLIAIDYQDGSSVIVQAVKGVGSSVLGGAERAASSVAKPVSRFLGAGSDGGGSGAQAATLERQLIALRARLSAAELAKAKYQQLARLLGLAGTGGYRIVAASVIAYGQGFARTVTLDAGRTEGIAPQQTVMNGDGLVGQVIAVSGRTCTVQLADAAGSVVGVRLAPAGQLGWVSGQGAASGKAGRLVLQVLDPAAVLARGEQLVTAASKDDRPYVPGVPVGVITGVRDRAGALTAQAFVRPYVDFAALDVVGVVITPPRVNPRFSVLPPPPPKPAPLPKPTPSPSRRPGRQAGPKSRH
jgi:rod shape-determining protein MreC